MGRRLRIAIDCRIQDARQGVATAVLAYAKALSDSKPISQEYTFIVREDTKDWLTPYIDGPCKIKAVAGSKLSVVKNSLQRIAPLRSVWSKLSRGMTYLPASDGYVEAEQFDAVHFPTQTAYLTKLPSIYQPWDLQHLHYPEFFSEADVNLRERYYRAFCDQATVVCVQAEWTRRDVISRYGLAEKKVVVIPWGSVLGAYEAPTMAAKLATIRKYGLPDEYFFYPAVTWAHKNHEAVLGALSVLKLDHGRKPNVYFTGAITAYRSELDRQAQTLDVAAQVHFIGFVSAEELQAIYGAATAMVFPSKFEGFGLPLLEAFHAGLPVLCSNAATLPEVALDAALYFDPNSPAELALQMKRILDEPDLRLKLARRGSEVLLEQSIVNTVAKFQRLYEEVSMSGSHESRSA